LTRLPAFRLPAALAPLLAFALGLAHALAFAPWSLPWLQVLALAGLFALAQRAGSARQAALLGFAFGLGWFGLGVSWVYISMHTYGGMPMALAALATAAFCAFLALYPALALALAQRAPQGVRLTLALPALWAGSEWLRGWLFTGFPWLVSGYAHSDGPLAGWAPLLGVYGMTLIAALVAAPLALVLTFLLTPRLLRTRAFIASAVAALGLVAAGQALRAVAWTQPDGAPIKVRLVQGNVGQDMKFTDAGLQRAIELHSRLLEAPAAGGRIDLAVLPESVFPLPLNYLPDAATRALLDFVRRNEAALVFGVFIEDPPGRFYNSAVGLRPDAGQAGAAPLQRYSKRHLVPFGEFIPWGFRWFVDLMRMPIGDQERGAPYQGPMDLAGQRIAVNICYEDLFGREIIAAWQVPERAPTLLLNISNLAWFDGSIALDQHLQISRLRALETGRPMLRATNTGATAVIDARGSVAHLLPFRTEAVLDAQVTGYVGTTPYVRWGDWPALAASLGLLLIAVVAGRRR
jgi:apolipoprotein N-acyltransferase